MTISLDDTALWATLRTGAGYVVLLRHALAPGTGDPPNLKLDDCTTQRTLSDEGCAQAIRIGNRFREQRIPVKRVLSSQWCRTLETARLMNLAPVESFPAINSFFQDQTMEDRQTDQGRAFIRENRQMVG